MRPIRVSVNAAANSQWIPVDYISAWFGITLGINLSSDANLTYSVQFSLDTPLILQMDRNITLSRAGVTVTVTDSGPDGLGHGLVTGDSVVIKGSGSSNLDSPVATIGNGDLGWAVASTPTPTTYTYTTANTGATTDSGSAKVARMRVFNHSTLAALTVKQNGTVNYPVQAVRLAVTAYVAGFADFTVLQGNAR